MTDQDHIDWSKTTFDGSRREQLKRWRALTLRERLEALDQLTARAERTHAMAARNKMAEVREPRPAYSTADGRNEIVLHGCTPTPLAAYLKALAVLRLVAEQAGDPDATGCWRDDVFVLRTRLSEDELLRFFLEDYAPTPLVAPWGGRSGFFPGSSERTAREALSRITKSDVPRLERYREAVSSVQNLLKKHGFDEKASDDRKLDLLNLCRSELPDHLLPWLDACYVLTADGRKFPPLLGTGGNEGSGSYVSGFAQQVVSCVLLRQHDSLLRSSLYGTIAFESRCDQTPGHFSPQALGGPNATSGFEANLLTNPWDYILVLEGTLLFAANATRRDEFSAPQVSFPFCVSPLADGGFGYVLDEERPKQAKRQVMELWLPLWETPCCLEELQSILSEGRVTVGRRIAETGLDFARAIAGFGVDRGIKSFQRYSFLMRNGQSFFAAPMERFVVRRNPAADLATDLETRGWLWRVQRHARAKHTPNAFRAATARLDAALFALTQSPTRSVVQDVLRQLGRIEAHCATSAKTREAIGPVPELSPEWVRRADDGSPEFRIALALAGLSLRGEEGGKTRYLGMRAHLAPVALDGRSWDDNAGLTCWGAGPIERNLAAVLHRRRIEAVRMNAEGEVLRSRTGATLADVQRFIDRQTDDRQIAELLAGLACADLGAVAPPQASEDVTPLPAYALLRPFFTSESLLRKLDWLPPDRSLRLPAEIPARLASGDADSALRLAWQRLRALGVKLPGRQPPCAAGIDSPRLLAALTIPLTFSETGGLLRWLDLAPEQEAPDEPLDETA